MKYYFYKISLIFIIFIFNGCTTDLLFSELRNNKPITTHTRFEPITLDGLEGYHLNNHSKEVLLVFGGKGFDIKELLPYVEDIYYTDIIVYNYNGYGLSNRKIIPKFDHEFKDNALFIFDTLKNYEKINVIGYSLGAFSTVFLNTQKNINKIVLIAPMLSVNDFMKEHFLEITTNTIYEPKNELKCKESQKCYLIEIDNDKVITKNMLSPLKEKFTKTFTIYNSTHEDAFKNEQFKEILKTIFKK